MSAQARSVVVRLSLDTAQAISNSKEFGREMTSAMDQAERASARAGGSLDKVTNGIGKIALGSTAALALMGKAAMDWESQWAGVTKTVDGSSSEMAQLEDDLRGLARTMPATHQEIAATAEAAGQLGVAREDIVAFTETMIQLGETTNLSADEAATSIAQMANVMGTAPEDISRVGSALVALGNDGASTEAQILGMAQRIAGAGAQIGLAESDVLAIANAAASMGIEVEAGGSAVSRVFTELAKATSQGGADLEAFSEVAGMSASDFARAFEADPARAFAAFTGGLDRINKSGGDVFTTLEQLGLSDVRVSQALLSMASAGDLLTDSLDLGAQAWQQNRALIEEYAKRSSTTESQVTVAWNNIRDAGIEAGGALLPAISEAANMVATLAAAFGELPGPVQNGVTGLLAVGAVLGGGAFVTLKAVSAISSTRAALTGLATSSPRTAGALRGVAKAAGALLIFQALVGGINAVQEALQGAGPSAEELTTQLLDLREGKVSDLGGEFDDLSDSIGRLADKNIGEKIGDKVLGALTFGQAEGRRLKEAKQDITALDEALMNIASAGGIDQARASFEQLAEAQGLSSEEQERLLGLLPGYSGALADADAEARLAGDSTEGYADATERAGAAAGLTADQIKELVDAMREQTSAALSAFDAQTQWGEAVAAAREAAKGASGGINEMTEAGRANRTVLSDLASAWNAQSDAVKNTNGEYGKARSVFIDTATAMGVPIAKARQLANQLLEIPPKRVVGVDVETSRAEANLKRVLAQLQRYGLTTETAEAALKDVASGRIKDVQGLINKYGITRAQAQALLDDNASGAINSVRSNLRGLHGDVAEVTIRTIRETVNRVTNSVTTFFGGALRRAGGGPVYGPGGPTDDMVPAMLSNKEFVMRAAAVEHYGLDTMFEMNALRFAEGGSPKSKMTASRARQRFDPDLDKGVSGLQAEIRELREDFKKSGRRWTDGMDRLAGQMVKNARTYERTSNKLERTLDNQASYMSDVRGSFDNNIFGNGVDGMRLQLEADRNDAQAMRRALRQAAGKGLDTDGGLFKELSASGDLTTALQLKNMSRREIAQLEKLYGSANVSQRQLAQYAGNQMYGEDIRELRQERRELRQTMNRLERRLEGLPADVRDGARDGTRDGMKDKKTSTNQRVRAGR